MTSDGARTLCFLVNAVRFSLPGLPTCGFPAGLINKTDRFVSTKCSFPLSAWSTARLVTRGQLDQTLLEAFRSTWGRRRPEQKRPFWQRLSHMLISLADQGPQDLQGCVYIVFYNGKWPSGSPNPIIYSTFWGSEKGPPEGPRRCPIHPSAKRPPGRPPGRPQEAPKSLPQRPRKLKYIKNI